MTKYIVRIRLADGRTRTETGLTEEAWSPREAATQRIKRLTATISAYDTGTVIVTELESRKRDAFYVYDWTREIVTSKEIKLS